MYRKIFILVSCFLLLMSRFLYGNIDSLLISLTKASVIEKPEILNQLAEEYIHFEPTKSLKYANEALQLAKKNHDEEQKARALRNIGQFFTLRSNFSQALNKFNQSLDIYNELGSEKNIAKLYCDIGKIYRFQSNYDEALKFHHVALKKFQKTDFKKGIARAYNNIGKVHWNLGDYYTALDYHFKALRILRNINDKFGLAEVLTNIGNVHYYLQEYQLAIEHYEQSLELHQQINNKNGIAIAYNNLGEVYEELNKFDKALEFHRKSLKITKDIGHIFGTTHSYNNIGEIYFALGSYDKAIEYYEKSTQLDKNIGNQLGIAYSLNNITIIQIKQEEFDKALRNMQEALRIAKEIKAKELIKEIYATHSDFFAAKDDYKTAMKYYKLFTNLKDKIYNEKIGERLANVMRETERISRERELLEKDRELQEAEIDKQRLVSYILVTGTIIILFFFVLLFRQNRKRLKAYKEMEHQKEEIASTETQVRKTNEKLKKSEERFRRIVQNIPVMISSIGEDGKFVFWNKECENVTGYTSDEIIGQPDAFELLYPNIIVREQFIKDFDYNEEKTWESIIRCKNKKKRIIQWTNVSDSVTIPGWDEWAIGIDITKRHEFEHSLTQEKALLNSLINSIPDIIFYKDKDGVYIGHNPAFSRFHGVEDNCFIGKTDYDIFPKDIADNFHRTDQQILKKKITWRTEKWELLPDGNKILLDTLKRPFSDAKGNVLGLVGISRDITERYKYEEALQTAKERAEEADKMKSVFLSNMSHEIRTPMNAIIGFADMLAKQDLSPEVQKEYIAYINSSAYNLLRLIDDIIDTAKIEAGEIKINRTECLVNKLLSELAISYRQEKKRMGKQTVELKTSMDNNNPEFAIITDPLRLRQILTNLINNAMKFTDKGYIEFGYTIIEQKHRQFLEFFVKDTGIGMPKNKLAKIFDRFGQVEETLYRNYRGTGLGLAISKNLTELLGGNITVESEYGKGTTFFFTIPYQKTDISKQQKNIQEIMDKNIDWSNKVILVAEDENLNYKLIEVALRKTKAKIIRANNGEEAIEVVKSKPDGKNVDLVLMDIQMPVMTGYEATKIIKDFDDSIPVIAQTAFAMAGEKNKSLEAGCDDYITKPILQNALLAKITQYIE